MAYSMNTDASTEKITLFSSGSYTGSIYHPSFTLSKVIMLDEWLLHFCSVEVVLLKHPTFFHESYVNGQVTLLSTNSMSQTKQITHELGNEIFNACLAGAYINRDTINISVIDTLLFNLLDFLKSFVTDR